MDRFLCAAVRCVAGEVRLVCYMKKHGWAEDSEEPEKCLKQKSDVSPFFKVHNGSRAAASTDFTVFLLLPMSSLLLSTIYSMTCSNKLHGLINAFPLCRSPTSVFFHKIGSGGGRQRQDGCVVYLRLSGVIHTHLSGMVLSLTQVTSTWSISGIRQTPGVSECLRVTEDPPQTQRASNILLEL